MELNDSCPETSLVPDTPPAHGQLYRASVEIGQPSGREELQRVCVFIEENLHEPLELADLAAMAGISRFHFARLFRLATGESPMRYVLRMRINRAMQLLHKPRGLIGDIALELGFYDQSHFTRSFRRFTGISPGEFARLCVARKPNRTGAAQSCRSAGAGAGRS